MDTIPEFKMPPYKLFAKKVGDSGTFISFSVTQSTCDFSDQWIQIPEADLGHVHFHINCTQQRVQGWILEGRSWEEHLVVWNESRDLNLPDLVTSSRWVYLISNAKRQATNVSGAP